MRKTVLTVLLSLAMTVSLQAQNESKLSLLIDAGPVFVTGPKGERDVSPWGLYGGAELAWRLNPYWSLVPLSLSYTWLSVDEDELAGQLGSTFTISEASQSMLALVPAVQFNTSPDRRAMGIFQLGLGWAHTMSDISGTIGGVVGNSPFDEDDSGDRLLLSLSGAVEGKLSERVSLTGRLKYWTVFDDEDSGGGNTNGLNVGLGLRFHY
jgi:hypothetical protein